MDDVRAEFGLAGDMWSGLANLKRPFAEFHVTLTSHQRQRLGQVAHVDGGKGHAFSYGDRLLVRDGAEGARHGWERAGMVTNWFERTMAGASATALSNSSRGPATRSCP